MNEFKMDSCISVGSGSPVVEPQSGKSEAAQSIGLSEVVSTARALRTTDLSRLPTWLRWTCFIAGIGSLLLLAIARTLTPSPLGHGTHQQLGLPPCTAVLLWSIPCPACGMTTSWALATRGEFAEAARANAGGLLLAIIALAFFPASCYFLALGRGTRGNWFSTLLAASLTTAMALSIVQWLIRVLS